jgi:hypothetical protein
VKHENSSKTIANLASNAMNEKQPFEQRISDKLQRLPLPDTESSWQQMKILLDDKMPRSGGFSPYGRWWWTGMIAVLFTALIWFAHEQYKSANELALAKTEKNDSSKTSSDLAKDDAGNKNNLSTSSAPGAKSSEADENTSVQKQPIDKASVKAINDNTSTLNTIENQKDKTTTAALANDKDEKNNVVERKKENGSGINPTTVDNKNNLSSQSVKDNNETTANKKGNNSKTNDKNISGDRAGNADAGLVTGTVTYSAANKSKKNNAGIASEQGNSDKAYAAGKAGSGKAMSDVVIETSGSAILHNGQQHSYSNRSTEPALAETDLSVNTDAAITETLTDSSSGSVCMSPSVLKKASIVAAIVNDKSRSKRTGEGFSLGKFFKSISLPYEGENWWAAGLALNTGVATGSQNRVNYNVNAKQGAALDYMPSPYLQYHVNSNLYMQTEFNFSAPQYTSQFLVAQKTTQIPTTNNQLQQSTYVQKLYYFNWPLSLYYSPVKNLFFNAGIQFSSLQSGLKIVEERKITAGVPSPTDPVYNSEVLKFKDDTVAARLTPNEWRWETGANYYLSRFTIGLKYNASFSNLVKIQPSPTLPANDSRNSAFLLFLRYNLWESRKKGSDKNYTSALFK